METLFDQYATRYLQGERPDVRASTSTVPAPSLVTVRPPSSTAFSRPVPAREPTAEEVVLVQARLEHQPPLLVLRLRRKLTRGAVVDAIVSTLGVDPAKREKVDGI